MKGHLSLVYKSVLQPGSRGKKTLEVEYPHVCQQIGMKDCGVFSNCVSFSWDKYFVLINDMMFHLLIAFDTANGDDLSRVQFQQCEMRCHLAECFKSNCMSSLPHHVTPNSFYSTAVNQFIILWLRVTGRIWHDTMCDYCDFWYHLTCVGVENPS